MSAHNAQIPNILASVFYRDISEPLPAAALPGSTEQATDDSPTSVSSAASAIASFPDLAKIMSASRRKVRNGLLDAVNGTTASTSDGRIRHLLAACRGLPELLRQHTFASDQDCDELHQKDPSLYPVMSPAVLSRVLSTRSPAWLKAVESRRVATDESGADIQVHGYLSRFADGPTVDLVLNSAAGDESFRLPFLTLAWEVAEAIVEPHKRELPLAAEIRAAAATLDDFTRAEAEAVAGRVGDALCRHAGLIDVCDKFFRPVGLVGKWITSTGNSFAYEVQVPEKSEAIVKTVETLALALLDGGQQHTEGRQQLSAEDWAALRKRFPFCPITLSEANTQFFHLLPAHDDAQVFEALVRLGQRYSPQYYRPLPAAPVAPRYDSNPEHAINGQWNIISTHVTLKAPEDWVFVLKWPPTHCAPDALPRSILRFFTLVDNVVWDGLSDPHTARVAGAGRTSISTPSLTFWNLTGRMHEISVSCLRRILKSRLGIAAYCIVPATGMTGLDATFIDTSRRGKATTPYPVYDVGFPPPFIWDFVESQRFMATCGTSAVA
ncbi:hypothetical protein AURDEDRAFT_151011, partial [Auricularia subglabra TFB-10046 SS5]